MKRFWNNLSLSKKVLLIIAVMGLSSTLAIAPVMFFSLKKALHDLQRTHLSGIKNLVERLIEENKAAIKNYAILFSKDREVKDTLFYHTVLAGERIHPMRAITHLVETFDVRYIELTDKHGRLIASTSNPELYYINRSQDPLIAKALKGKTTVGFELQPNGLLLKAVSPIYYDQGQLIGTLSTGVIMNNIFLQKMKKLSGVDLAIVDKNGTVVASTIDTLRSISIKLFKNKQITHYRKKYLLIQLPLGRTGGLSQFVILTKDKVPELLRRLYTSTLLTLFLITAIFIVTTFLVLQRVLNPVQLLKKGAHEIGKGNFEYRIVVNSNDEFGQLALVFNNMAENLQKMREIEKRLQHSERLASIGQFTSGIAHEINNPIANILGLLKLIRRELPEDSTLKEDIEIAIKEAQRCGRIVRDLLLYSRGSPPSKEPVNLNQLIEGVLEDLKLTIDGKNIKIIKHYSNALPIVNVDPFQMEQVIRNIVLNAIQAVNDRDGTIKVCTSVKDNMIEIIVADNGCGIKKQHLQRIFYPFFTTKKTGEGTGLGLTVSYGIINAHGGDIKVESEEGKGTTFYILIPLQT